MQEGQLLMTQADRDRLVTLKKAEKKLITQRKTAEELELSIRQVQRLLDALQKHGGSAVVQGLRGRASNRKIEEKVEREAVKMLAARVYQGCWPTLAAEYLEKKHGIGASKETVRQWMIRAQLWKGKKAKVQQVHVWRPRRRSGFKTYVETGVAPGPAQTRTVNAALGVGDVVSEVDVSASAAQVQISTSEVASHVDQAQIENLPLNGRNYQGLAAVMPGVVNTSAGQGLGTGGFSTYNVMSINGMDTAGTLYLLDGIWNMNTGWMRQTTIQPNPDQIQEVRVLQNNYSVKYSLMGTSVVLVQTKSGTDRFHGDVWEYLRNSDFDARNFFTPAVSPLHQNMFGYDIGGPVFIPKVFEKLKNKTFFYWNQQFVRRSTALTSLRGATPTGEMRNGTFNSPIIDPKIGRASCRE